MSVDSDEIVRVLLRERLRIMAMVLAVLRDSHSADDVFQQVVLSALENRDTFRDGNHVLAWSIRAARFRAIDMARLRKLRPLSESMLDRLESRWDAPDEFDANERSAALAKCLERLNPSVRRLLWMRYGEGVPIAMAAERFRRTTDALYQQLSRAQRALRECVGRELFDLSPAERRAE